MGFFKVLKDLKELIFSSKRNVVLTLILGIIILSIPFSLQLIESQKVIRSRAEEGGNCSDIANKQNPSAGDQCASCIVNNNRDLIDSIKRICNNSSFITGKSNLELINYWCNQVGQADCNTKKATCGSVCGTAANGDCRPDLANLTITPSSVAAGSQIVFQASGSQGTAYIEEDYGGGASSCTFTAEPSIPRATHTCRASSTPSSYTWTHKWRNSEGGTLCQKTQTYTVTATIANNATCGTITTTPDNSVRAGQSFNVSITMSNPAGAKSWVSAENYRLGRWDGTANAGWVFPHINNDRVTLPSSPVNAGNSAAFNFSVTAPDSAGPKKLELRMIQDGIEWFGQTCSKDITVTAASSPSPSPSPRTSPSPSPSPRTSPSPQPPVAPACIRGDLDGNRCISPGFTGNDFQTWLRVVTGQDSGKADVFPPCAGDGKVDINDFNLWLIESLRPGNQNICR